MKIGSTVQLTTEAGQKFPAFVLYVHARENAQPELDLTYVDPGAHLPNGPAVPMSRMQVPHESESASGKAFWSHTG